MFRAASTPPRPRGLSSRTRACRSTSSNANSGHTNLGVTSIYLQGIDNAEIIATVHARLAPMMPATAGLALDPRAR
jgi:hypothetical protein